MRAVVFNLGCKVNRYESDVLAQELRSAGYDVFDELVPADIYVLNTCAVTAEAERKSRQSIARCRALNANAKIFICGCASQKSPDSFKKDNVVFIGGTSAKSVLLTHLEDATLLSEIKENPSTYEDSFLTTANRTRAYVKIQDGCNSFCSYCIIPFLRGRSRSRGIDSIVKEVDVLSAQTSEIVLTGINLMEYGKDIGTSLAKLVRALSSVNVRIRIGSFYAEGITEEFLDALFSLKKFCPHFHLSLQSGDDRILKDMNRKYTADIYRKKIEMIRSYDPNACITTDIITGYPTEGEINHRNTVTFVRDLCFSDIHVFPFSARVGTKAASLPVLSPGVVKERKDELLILKKRLQQNYLSQNIGMPQHVLTEEKDGDYYVGYSQYYIRVYTRREGEITCIPTQQHKDGLKEV
ncbi:MAG: tRNA (N(6)-L-threonylcarbamoyladenosine(37)-C(2))-methylthiotransferase MtaB [Clostridia bacterium]|nr:tRNA (N(6)-L-threonylcarbamoyladenosine(37)-C(2))-methylthiotransferase MtaB [Clostridia bacterium]